MERSAHKSEVRINPDAGKQMGYKSAKRNGNRS
jgi:hypothetical protein